MLLRVVLSLILLVLIGGSVWPQQAAGPGGSSITPVQPPGVGPPRSVSGERSVTDFRPVGEARLWDFFAKGKSFGQLLSIVAGVDQVDGRPAVVLSEKYHIDYSNLGVDRKVQMAGSTWVATNGPYLGTKLSMTIDSTTEHLQFMRSGDKVGGSFTRAGRDVEQSVEIPRDRFAWDKDFVDQLELYLAMHDLDVGDTLIDTLVVPRTMTPVPLHAVVRWWMWQEIYKGYVDSVFIIRFTEPQEYQAYFTETKRLVRLDMISQNIRVYQDTVMQTKAKETAPVGEQMKAPRYSLTSFVIGLPHYIAYLVIALLVSLFLGLRAYRWKNAYIAFLIGVAGFVIVPFTQIPLQRFIIKEWLIPGVTGGASVYLWAAIPALAAAIIQVLIVTGLLYLLFEWRNPKARRYGALGACLGAAFGFAESSYLLGTFPIQLFSWLLFERLFWIIFHGSIGGLLGLGIFKGQRNAVTIMVLAVIANAWLRYIPVFVQQGAFDVQMGRILVALTGLLALVYAVIVLGSDRKSGQQAETT